MQSMAEHWTPGLGPRSRSSLWWPRGPPLGRGPRVRALARVRRSDECTKHQDRREKQGQWRPLRLLTPTLEPTDPAPLPSRARESRCLGYTQTKVCVLFSGFPAGAAMLRLTTRGQAVPTVLSEAIGAGKGHPGVILGIPCPHPNRHL